MFEIPTHQNINSSNTGKSDMQGVSTHACTYSAFLDVGRREFLHLWGKQENFNVRNRNLLDNPSNSFRSCFQFAKCELRYHKSEFATYKCLNQAEGMFAEFVVFTTTQD